MSNGHSGITRPREGFARPMGINPMAGTYNGAELAMQPARTAAASAREIPTRVGPRLHYRDGRVTDLDGQPMQQAAQRQQAQEPVFALPPLTGEAAVSTQRFYDDIYSQAEAAPQAPAPQTRPDTGYREEFKKKLSCDGNRSLQDAIWQVEDAQDTAAPPAPTSPAPQTRQGYTPKPGSIAAWVLFTLNSNPAPLTALVTETALQARHKLPLKNWHGTFQRALDAGLLQRIHTGDHHALVLPGYQGVVDSAARPVPAPTPSPAPNDMVKALLALATAAVEMERMAQTFKTTAEAMWAAYEALTLETKEVTTHD